MSETPTAEKDAPTYTEADMAEAWRSGAQEGFGAPSDWNLHQVYALNPYVLPPASGREETP